MTEFQDNLTLLLNTTVTDVKTENGKITAVSAYQMTTEKRLDIQADYFADCTGDATIAAKAYSARRTRLKSEAIARWEVP